jgi:3'-phosphoadenosine 5'-phosphosulfate sulfotransferase (PAPS reductase)/FAD synthetase
MKKIVMYGAGQDSTGMIVEMINRKMKIDEVIFSDTGAEQPETYEFIKEFKSYLKKHKIKFTIVKSSLGSLYDYYFSKRVIPFRLYRHCTDKFKIVPIRKYLQKKYKGKEYVRLFGIACDEKQRADKIRLRNKDVEFPLLEFGFDRKDCIETIKKKGLSVPVKSGCYICPFQSKRVWRELLDKHPELFEKARKLEENAKCFPEFTLSQEPLSKIEKWKKQTRLFEDARCVYCEVIK